MSINSATATNRQIEYIKRLRHKMWVKGRAIAPNSSGLMEKCLIPIEGYL
jgi:1-deoxy-D-xylulose 5-phosphate reductoisomerase